MNSVITYIFMGVLFATEDMKKVQVPQWNEMLSLYHIALGFVSKNEYNPK